MPKTQLEKLWLFGGLVVGLLVTVFAYLLVIGPQRSHTTDVNDKVSAAQDQNTRLQARISALTAQNKKLATYQQAVHDAQLALPATSGLPDFLRTLQSVGAATSTNLTSLSVGEPSQLVTSGAATTKSAGTGSTPASGQGSTSASSSSSGSAQVYALPITAQVSGAVGQLDEFLVQLQSVQPRAVLISAVTEAAANSTGTNTKGTGAYSLNLTMQAFVAPVSGTGAAGK
jgi:hypothetical protein